MPAYIAFLIDIRDQAAFSGDARAATPTYAMYSGSVALRGPSNLVPTRPLTRGAVLPGLANPAQPIRSDARTQRQSRQR